MITNAIIINGITYEFTDAGVDKDECTTCDLYELCDNFPDSLCVMLFDDVISKCFKRKE